MINPHRCYITAFLLSLLVYQFRWSDYFPTLGAPLVIFVLATVLVHFAEGRQGKWRERTQFTKVPYHKLLVWVTVFMYGLWSIEFLYEGGVPIVKILLGRSYDYRQFGVPTLHVLIVTLSSFFTTFLFHVYLSTRNKKALVLYGINLLAAVLIMNRGMLLLNVCSSVFLFLFSLKKIDLKISLKVTAILFVILGFFGVLGNLRVSRLLNKFYDRSIVYKIGKANESFKENVVPGELFWPYLYIGSPLANLQQTIEKSGKPEWNTANVLGFINSEFLPDFISKRINGALGTERKRSVQVADHLNASTVYARAYAYLGWTGIIILALAVLFFATLYVKWLSSESPFFLTGMATLCTLYTFLIFDNFFVFSGFSFQLAYPFVFTWLEKQKVLTLTQQAI